MTTSDADSTRHRGHTCPPLLQMAGHRGHREYPVEQQTDQTVLTITKALTKTTHCTFRAKKVEGHDQKFFSGTLHRIGAPTFKFVPAPPCGRLG